MTFAKGVYLHLLWLLPLLLLLTLWSRRRSRRDHRALFGSSIGQDVAPEDLWRRRAWRSFLVFLGLSLAVVAMAQPRWGHSWKEQEVTGLEIIVALDVSRSMDAQDVDPSRIERARRETLDLIEAMPSSRIGLVLFAGGAYPRMPQTLDHQALRGILSRTDTQTIRAQGSSIGAALKEARGLMDLDRKADRAVLLLSDGENWDRGLQEETAALAQAGIRVYSVGIGTLAGAPIPKPGGGFKTNMSGEVVLSQLNESALKEVASATEGAYVQSVGGAGDTREVVSALNLQLARSAQGQQREKVWQERYQWPLGLGFEIARNAPRARTPNVSPEHTIMRSDLLRDILQPFRASRLRYTSGRL